MKARTNELRYFVLKLNGREYGGWYRLVDDECIEVIAPGFLSTVLLDGRAPEDVSCQLLEQFIRVRMRQGAPLPAASTLPPPRIPDRVCGESDQRTFSS